MHDSFRDSAPVTQLSHQENDDDQCGEYVPLKRRVAFAEDDIKQLLPVTHTQCYKYGECMLDIAFVMCTERLAWMLDKYGRMLEYNVVGPCSGKYSQATTMLN